MPGLMWCISCLHVKYLFSVVHVYVFWWYDYIRLFCDWRYGCYCSKCPFVLLEQMYHFR